MNSSLTKTPTLKRVLTLADNKQIRIPELELWCPENLDLDEIIKKSPLNKLGLKKDHLLFIIHSLINQGAIYSPEHLLKKGKKDGYIPLNSRVMKSNVPQYGAHIKYLEDAEIITSDGSYRTDHVSTGYKFTEKYAYQVFKKVTITDHTLRKKLRRKKQLGLNRDLKNLYPYLVKSFDKKLNIDVNGATKWIDDHFTKEKLKISDNKSWTSAKRREKNNLLFEKCQRFKTLVHNLNDHDYYCTVDSAANRLHTNLTNLRKELRQFITYDNKPLVSIDVKNSQPYFSMLLFDKNFWSSRHIKDFPNLRSIWGERYRKIQKDKENKKSIIMCIDSLKSQAGMEFQEDEFFQNVVNGTFYERLIQIFEKDLSSEFEITTNEQGNKIKAIFKPDDDFVAKRIKVKKIALSLLFDDDKRIYNQEESSACNVFAKHFPTIAKMFQVIKENDHSSLAIILQRIESFILLKKVCGRISKERPDLTLFTIHDSIITTAGNESYVQQVIEEELRKIMGVAPKLSIEHWGRGNV